MKFLKMLWLWVALAALASLAVAFSRIGWEQEYKKLAVAVNLGDLYKLAPQTSDTVGLLRELQAVVVSPQDVWEFSHVESAPVSLTQLKRLRELGFSLYWKLDGEIPSEKFSVLFELQPRGLLLGRPFTFSPQQFHAFLDLLREYSTLIGILEFHDPWLVDQLHRQGFHDFVRVHTLKIEERAPLSEREALERYMRAAIERNVRLLELRALQPDQIVREHTALRAELQRAGFSLGDPSSPERFQISVGTLELIWIGLVSLLALMVERLLKPSWFELFWLWLMGVAIGLVGFLQEEYWMQQGAAFLMAVIVPVAAFVFLHEKAAPFRRDTRGFAFWLACSAISLLGGLGAAAFLSEDLFFLRIEEFAGVKLALTLPILCVALLVMLKIGLTSLQLREVFMGLGIGLLLFFVLARSGNLSILPPTEIEQQLRTWLEDLLWVRPRFKEFLIGHPLLILWGGLGSGRWRPWAMGILLMGLIGQVSIINSFVHLHTPLWVTLMRTVHGLWLGAVLGWLLQALFARVLRQPKMPAID